jgi:UDP-N-acetylglucosamine 2-epimerase (non-hydrolysing)
LKTTVKKNYHHPILEQVQTDRMLLMTAHRRENLGEPMRNIFTAIRQIVDEFTNVQVVYPVHLNSVVRETVQEILGNHERIHLIEPLDVIDFILPQERT